jgi:hypothetical protein
VLITANRCDAPVWMEVEMDGLPRRLELSAQSLNTFTF